MKTIYSIDDLKTTGIIANSSIDTTDLEFARNTILNIYQKTKDGFSKGKGPFFAEIYDKCGNLVAGASNSVVEESCALCHAEINAIKIAHQKLNSYDLSDYDLSIYINAEPCVMCAGAIMWSGIKRVFFGVESADVEKITGFDEGYKPDWINEFKKRCIKVYGSIEKETGMEILREYVENRGKIYMPQRNL